MCVHGSTGGSNVECREYTLMAETQRIVSRCHSRNWKRAMQH
jgi:hypothetical protein